MNLSSRAVALAAGTLLLGAAGLWAGGALERAWCYPAVLLLAALLIEGQWAKRVPITADWRLPVTPRLGQATALELCLSQAGRRELRLDLLMALPAAVGTVPAGRRLALSAGGSVSLRESFVPVALGELRFPGARVRLLGRFGLAWWTRALVPPGPAAVTVTPDSLHADERPAPGARLGQAAPLRRGHGLELLGLRDYRPGDPLRAIVWKASARSGRLMVRDTLADQHLEVALVLDVGRTAAMQAGALSRLHHYVNTAARFGERAVTLGDRLTLVVLASEVRLSLTGLSGAAGLRRLRKALSDLRPVPEESNPPAGALEVRRLLRHRGLVVWLGDADAADGGGLMPAALLLARQHVAVFAQILDDEILTELDRPARTWLDPYVALAAQQSVHQQVLASRQLARLGCEIVAARPAQLERQLVERYLFLRARRRV